MKQVSLVGILNVTPDSFSDGGLYDTTERAVAHAEELFAQGAEIVDIGAESTNPRSKPISTDVEWARLEPVLDKLLPWHAGHLSVDTHDPDTISRIVVRFGPHVIINDVTGMNIKIVREVVGMYKLRCIISHLPARFDGNIQAAHRNADLDDEQVVLRELLVRREQMMALGIRASDIILDPGIGFGKTMRLNRQLLNFARLVPDCDVMIGYSRKRFLGEHRFELAPNLAAADMAVKAGARYLRVHDVAAHYEHLFGRD